MITQGGFTKKEQKELKTARENKGRKAIGDTDYNNKGEGNRGSAAKTKAKTSAPKTHTATQNNKHQTDSARTRMAKKQEKGTAEVALKRRRKRT